MNILLIAILSYSGGQRGYQSSVMQRLDSWAQCQTAASALVETYKGGNISENVPDRGQIRCVDLSTKKSAIIVQF